MLATLLMAVPVNSQRCNFRLRAVKR